MITIDTLTVNNDASAGTIIGTLSAWDASGNVVPCNYTLTKGSAGLFAVSDGKLITIWGTPITPGYYSVRVHAVGTTTRFSGSATFTANVVIAASSSASGGAQLVPDL
jgi:hypothetical protein